MSTAVETVSLPTPKQLNFFERYLTLWVALCMVVGITLGRFAPFVVSWLRGMELGQNSKVNFPLLSSSGSRLSR